MTTLHSPEGASIVRDNILPSAEQTEIRFSFVTCCHLSEQYNSTRICMVQLDYNQRGVACCYNFHPEELFLYMMTRMKTGNDHTQMCGDIIFGGSPRRWSIAWRWIMKYLAVLT